MTSTIEVPISLIKEGDLDAIRELLPKPESLFGRWATHPEYGRVLTIDDKQDRAGKVCVARLSGGDPGGAERRLVPFDSLEFDPDELVTEQDFHDAPEGTIVIADGAFPRMKQDDNWGSAIIQSSARVMESIGPWQVVRWGKGEQQ